MTAARDKTTSDLEGRVNNRLLTASLFTHEKEKASEASSSFAIPSARLTTEKNTRNEIEGCGQSRSITLFSSKRYGKDDNEIINV